MYVLRKPHDLEDMRIHGELSALICEDESLTDQQFVQDADLNVIVKRMGLQNADLPAPAVDPRFYGDFSEAPTTLADAIAIVDAARDRFLDLPAELRNRFQNDPVNLWSFVNDPRNLREAVKLGLLQEVQGAKEPPDAGDPSPAPSE